MTDNEIINAKRHYKYGITHDIFKEPVVSYAKTVLWAFDEVERQKTEIDILIRKKEALRDEIAEQQAKIEALINGQKTLQKHIAEQKAEIERLEEKSRIDDKLLNDRVQEAVNSVSIANQKYVDALEKALNNKIAELKSAKSEAIKEFAERLKERLKDVPRYDIEDKAYYAIGTYGEFIDNLVKEMTE
jgi:chromosome segregation ATPase